MIDRIRRLINRMRCLLGFHDWHRSKFVALNCRVAPLVCQRCFKQIQDE